MTRYRLPSGSGRLTVTLPDDLPVAVVAPPPVAAAARPDAHIRAALAHPVGAPALERMVRSTDRVAVVVDDVTRQTPVAAMLPPVLERLAGAGIPRRQIAVVIALGTHRPMTAAEIDAKLGAAVARGYRVVNRPAAGRTDLVDLGTTARGVAVRVDATVAGADVRIGMGMIMPHLDAGFGGGAKILVPGVCGEETVDAFHRQMAGSAINPLGMAEAPLRLDLERFVGERLPLHLIVNAILNQDGALYRCVAGDPVLAHRHGVGFAREVYGATASQRFPVVIANAHPHQIDLWQSTKALAAGERLTRSGGDLILVADCPEGAGPHPRFADYIGMDPDVLLRLLADEAVEDPCAAAEALAVCRMKRRMRIGVVSPGLSADTMRRLGVDRYASVEEAVERSRARHGAAAVALLPWGGTTLPVVPEAAQAAADYSDG